jgi:hypothetical protein
MADEREANSNESLTPPPRPYDWNGVLGDRPELDPLPPPAFPPSERGAKYRRALRIPLVEPGPAQPVGTDAGEVGVPDEAFISPDDPIVRAGSRIAPDAFISPDEPLLDPGPSEGVVTGIGNDPHLDDTNPTSPRHTDPHVAGLVGQVGRLADTLRDRGEVGLRTTDDMSRFEATLRAYCVGYLVAQRASEED